MDSGTINVILGSSDSQAHGTAGDYNIEISPIRLEGSQWEIRLCNVSFSPPAVAQDDQSVFVYLSCVALSTIGSTQARWLFRTPPQRSGSTNLLFIQDISASPVWMPIDSSFNTLHRIDVNIQSSDGTPIPNTNPSIMQLQLRRVA